MANGKIQVLTPPKNQGKKANEKIVKNSGDIIVIKAYEEETVNEKGEKTIKTINTKVNITKKVNETAKLVKERTAQQKLEELEKIFSK